MKTQFWWFFILHAQAPLQVKLRFKSKFWGLCSTSVVILIFMQEQFATKICRQDWFERIFVDGNKISTYVNSNCNVANLMKTNINRVWCLNCTLFLWSNKKMTFTKDFFWQKFLQLWRFFYESKQCIEKKTHESWTY